MSVARGILLAVLETRTELDQLQTLLDSSLSGSSPHLRSIIRAGERTLDADQLTRVLTGMCVLELATVTARGEPRISALDGYLLHGQWVFGTEATSPKARHLAARPAVSASHVRGEELGVFTHGNAELLYPGDHADWPEVHAFLTEQYGVSPLTFGDNIVYYRIRPHWMVAYTSVKEKLLAEL